MKYASFPDDITIAAQRWKVIGVDIGTKRIGVAMSDPDRILATPIETIARVTDHAVWERLRQIIVEQEARAIVFGIPFNLSGKAGIAVANIQKFVTEAADYFHNNNTLISIYTIDERLSTALANSQLRQTGHNSKTARKIIDQAAAVAILQSWLDRYRQLPIS